MTRKAPDRLDELDQRLEKLRAKHAVKNAPKKPGKWQGAEMAWGMVIELTTGVMVGFGMGWGLDEVFGTKPLFLVPMTLLGFAAGVRVMLRSAKDAQRRGVMRDGPSDASKDKSASALKNKDG